MTVTSKAQEPSPRGGRIRTVLRAFLANARAAIARTAAAPRHRGGHRQRGNRVLAKLESTAFSPDADAHAPESNPCTTIHLLGRNADPGLSP
jgi:hypothetical protein